MILKILFIKLFFAYATYLRCIKNYALNKHLLNKIIYIFSFNFALKMHHR